jgi:hypothetical protein
MKTLITLLLVALCSVLALAPQGVRADPPGIPAAVYPLGAHIDYRPVLSNTEMDCMWGFFCEGNVPLFHFATEDQLHRFAGWGQFAGVQRRHEMTMGFQLFVSQYASGGDETGMPWAERAFIDLRRALSSRRYNFARSGFDLPAPLAGGNLIAVQKVGKQNLVVMASWSQGQEIEGIAFYDHRSRTAGERALTCLAGQIRFASNGGM